MTADSSNSFVDWRRAGAIAGVLVLAALAWIQMGRVRDRAQRELAQRPDPAVPDYDCLQERPQRVRSQTAPPGLVDITKPLGIDFRHIVGPPGTWFMPESIGAGAAVLDYDRDGLQDLYFVNCGPSPGAVGSLGPAVDYRNRLYRQTSSGRFEDVTDSSGLGDTGYGAGVAVGDVDNDGLPDVFIANYTQDSLYRNTGQGTFENITAALQRTESDWGAAAAFVDYDRDGWLDLLVVNYTADPQYGHSVSCGFSHGLVSYCGPHKFQPTIDRLYHNETGSAESGGQVRFRDVTEAAGLAKVTTFGFGTVCMDLTGDEWPDLFIANDGAPNRLWVNQRDGTFLEEATLRGTACNQAGHVEAGMGAAAGDVNADGIMDLLVTHLTKETATLYVGNRDGLFQDRTPGCGIDLASRGHTGWGVSLLDLNHDGLLDIPIVNGLVIPCHSGFPFHGEDEFQVRKERIDNTEEYWRAYHDENVLLLGSADGRWQADEVAGGDFVAAQTSGRSLACGDLDNDGDPDLIVTSCGTTARCYRNDLAAGNWLLVKTETGAGGRDAIGARVILQFSDGSRRTACCLPQSSYLASSDSRVHFGLGARTDLQSITVVWPDGPVDQCVERFAAVPVNQQIVIRRGTGQQVEQQP